MKNFKIGFEKSAGVMDKFRKKVGDLVGKIGAPVEGSLLARTESHAVKNLSNVETAYGATHATDEQKYRRYE